MQTKADAKKRALNLNRRVRSPRSFVVMDTGQKGKGILSKLPKEATAKRFVVKPANPRKRKMAMKKADGGTGKMSPNFTGRTSGASTVALRRRGLDKGRRDMLNTFKEAKRMNKSGRMTLSDVEAVAKRNKAKLGQASKKALDKRRLDKTKRAVANKNKSVRDKLKITKFMKRGGKAKK